MRLCPPETVGTHLVFDFRVARAAGLACVVVSAVTATAAATPPPLELTRQRGRLDARAAPLTSEIVPLSAIGAADVESAAYDVTLDPASGEVSARVTLALGALTGPVAAFSLYLDAGLSVSAASAPSTTVSHTAYSASPYSIVSLTFDPPIAPGETLDVQVDYGGTLACAATSDRSLCSVGGEMPYLLEGSAIPALRDASGLGGYNVWGAKRSLTLRLPAKLDVLATGELAQDSDDGGTRVTHWETPGYQSIGSYVVVMGSFDATPAIATSVPSSVFSASQAPLWRPEMAGWMQTILPFLDAQAGAPLPYPELNVVKTPGGTTFPGTAGHGITLLSEDYGKHGARYFEETLAHESSHQWWGVLVSPTDAQVSRWLTEGLATLTQVDYSAARLVDAAEREAYLARRYREHRVLMRYHTQYETFPPLVVSHPGALPAMQPGYTIWAYIRSAAVLEHLRAALGDAVFAQALAAYAASCRMAACDTSDFRLALEHASGRDLVPAFATLVYGSHYPAPALGFVQQATRLRVELGELAGVETPLELWIELEDGSVVRRRIVAGPGPSAHELDAPGSVRRVRLNPRHDAVIWSRSAQPGDLDFDREVDGLDLIGCARALGRSADLTGQVGDGILGIDLDFDPRCDSDQNGEIDAADLAPTLQAFGTVVEGD